MTIAFGRLEIGFGRLEIAFGRLTNAIISSKIQFFTLLLPYFAQFCD